MTFWVFRWIEEERIRTIADARSRLAMSEGVVTFREYASRAEESSGDVPVNADAGILAGRGLDLSGELDCQHEDCLKRQVDRLFTKTWHYFDEIVVDDLYTHRISVHWDEHSDAEHQEWLWTWLGVMLHIVSVGAAELLVFRAKPHVHEQWRRRARESGLVALPRAADALAKEIAPQIEFGTEAKDNLIEFSVNHPLFEHTYWGSLPKRVSGGKGEAELRLAASRQVVGRFASGLTDDFVASRRVGVPLGAGVRTYQRLFDDSTEPASVPRVAFELKLPVLEGVSVRDLIALRSEERDAFTSARTRLRQAIRQLIDAGPSKSPTALAEQVRDDVVEPELARIRTKLKQAEGLLQKGSALTVGLTGFATICGLLPGLSLADMIPVAVSTLAAGTLASVGAYEKARSEVRGDAMYFYWKASTHDS
jgi:hypothetical protein